MAGELRGIASNPGAVGSFLNRLMARQPANFSAIGAAERAIARVTDDVTRAKLARCLYRWMDVQRVWLGNTTLPSDSISLYTACVPFQVKNFEFMKDPTLVLEELTGPIDEKFVFGPRDALLPSHKNFVLCVPLVGVSAFDRWVLNFMLANSHMDTPIDQHYWEMWRHFSTTSINPDEAVFGFIFSAASMRPLTSPPEIGTVDIPHTPWVRHAVQVIEQHARDLNGKHPSLGLTLQPMVSFSEAVEGAAELRFGRQFVRIREGLGKRTLLLGDDAAALHGISDAELFEMRAEAAADTPMTAREVFGKAVLGLCTVDTDNDSAQEFLQLNLFGLDKQLILTTNLMVPLGSTVDDARRWWSLIDVDGLADVVFLPTVSEDIKKMRIGMTRDEQGNWVDRQMLSWGEDATTVFRTGSWAIALGSEVVKDAPKERIPVPDAMQQLGLMKAAGSRFQPEVFEFLRRQMAIPGMDFKAAYADACLKFEVLHRVSIVDLFNGFIPSGMWTQLHHEQVNGVLFRVDPSVQEQLDLTDVENKFPLQLLRTPFPDIYLHLERREKLVTEHGLIQYLDGAYVSERAEVDDNGRPAGRLLTITLALNDETALVSLTYPSISFLIENEDSRDLAEILRETVDRVADDMRKNGQEVSLETMKAGAAPLMSICKVLLYISLPQARLSFQMRRRDLMDRARSASGRERQRLFDRAHKERDVIVVGPLPPMETLEEGAPSGHGVKPHPRRGFCRSQRHGEGLKLVKLVWIPPVMVNKHLIAAGHEPEPKQYKVK
jgi:hypothetical protein